MHSKLDVPAAAFAGLVTTGLLALPISSAFAADDVKGKRPDDTPDLVLVTDDDNDADFKHRHQLGSWRQRPVARHQRRQQLRRHRQRFHGRQP